MTERFLMILFLIALGYTLKRLGFINGKDSRVISVLVLNVTLPSVVIVNLNHVHLSLSLAVLPVMMVLYGIVTKILIAYLFIKYNNEVRGTVATMMAALNIGIFAYPLVQQIWPEKGLLYFGMADIGGAVVMFGLTYFAASYFKQVGGGLNPRQIGFNMVKSVPLMTYLIMLLLNIFSLHLPAMAIDFFEILGQANLPLSMILLGVLMDFKIERRFLPLTLKYLALHYGFGLFFGTLVYFFLPVEDDMIKTTLQLIWLLPVGVAALSYAVQFKYRTLPVIAMASNVTIVISIVILYCYQYWFVR
ncbi:AEC family transporter [Staphylococcus lutrae]|uniref:Malonate transporter n=1 Tax=Staphylococcus lutrae TaxID=155085 RepID=A0AAC9RT52_9STAP|nr:AEC family transporter [Staphylococcus lutrae]ARJ50412.1 malonate transporter [Staphylococcus lutrae]PNZ38758.1 AEC family transporter [Staphylococcus lutrae]